MKKSFAKTLSGNDVGETGSHQAGICVPKKNQDLCSFFPQLDAKIKNPDCWLICEDENGDSWKLRFVYYDSKTLGVGTRNEYRITHLTSPHISKRLRLRVMTNWFLLNPIILTDIRFGYLGILKRT